MSVSHRIGSDHPNNFPIVHTSYIVMFETLSRTHEPYIQQQKQPKSWSLPWSNVPRTKVGVRKCRTIKDRRLLSMVCRSECTEQAAFAAIASRNSTITTINRSIKLLQMPKITSLTFFFVLVVHILATSNCLEVHSRSLAKYQVRKLILSIFFK